MSKYIELYPDSITLGEGLISSLFSLEGLPWDGMDSSTIISLERAYGVRSAYKTVSELYELVPKLERAKLLRAMYGEKWQKLWDNFKLNYNPLDAYIVTEEGSNNRTNTVNRSTEYGHIINDDSTNTGTVTNEGSASSNGEEGVYGFNSLNSVPSETSEKSSSDNSTETRDLAAGRKTEHSGVDSANSSDTEKGSYNLTKRGNIGYSTPQKLLREDMELWREAYFNIVFSDIDSVIMLNVYD